MSNYKHIYNAMGNTMHHLKQAQEMCEDMMSMDKEACGPWKKQLKEVEKQINACYKQVEKKHNKAYAKKEPTPTIQKKSHRLKKITASVYTDNGYKNRKDYLQHLADEFGLDLETVYDVAAILGPDEDFDGLVSALEDYDF